MFGIDEKKLIKYARKSMDENRKITLNERGFQISCDKGRVHYYARMNKDTFVFLGNYAEISFVDAKTKAKAMFEAHNKIEVAKYLASKKAVNI